MMTSLATKYYQFVLAQGILEGIACGMIFTPTVSTVGQYFTTKRAWAMGFVVSGASIGGVVFPITLNRLLNVSNLGFGWILRVVGFMMLILLAFACIVMKEHAPRRKHKFLLPEAFSSAPYVFATLAFFFTLFGLWTPIFYISDYALLHGMNPQLAYYQISILNATSFFGRTLPGFAADRVGRFNTSILMMICSSILVFCWTTTQSSAAIIVFIALYGFFAGAVVSLVSPCLAQGNISPRLPQSYYLNSSNENGFTDHHNSMSETKRHRHLYWYGPRRVQLCWVGGDSDKWCFDSPVWVYFCILIQRGHDVCRCNHEFRGQNSDKQKRFSHGLNVAYGFRKICRT